MEIVTGMVR